MWTKKKTKFAIRRRGVLGARAFMGRTRYERECATRSGTVRLLDWRQVRMRKRRVELLVKVRDVSVFNNH